MGYWVQSGIGIIHSGERTYIGKHSPDNPDIDIYRAPLIFPGWAFNDAYVILRGDRCASGSISGERINVSPRAARHDLLGLR